MYLLRTRFKKEIVCEFLPPARKSNKVIILCGGVPSMPGNKKLAEFLSEKGFWVFKPRYRGSWESDGNFLEKSPEIDIRDVIDGLFEKIVSIYDGIEYDIKPKKIYLVGSSFGGPAVILNSKDERVTKVFAFSPVIDWSVESKTESIDWLGEFTKQAFGNGYRFSDKDWNKLKTGKFYNPISFPDKIDPKKVFIVYSKDDEVVPFGSTKDFINKNSCKSLLLNKGGHLSTSLLLKARFYNIFSNLIK